MVGGQLGDRERWLQDWLTENEMCQSGHVVETIDKPKAGTALTGDIYQVHVEGRCR
jgi:hypothetical protein